MWAIRWGHSASRNGILYPLNHFKCHDLFKGPIITGMMCTGGLAYCDCNMKGQIWDERTFAFETSTAMLARSSVRCSCHFVCMIMNVIHASFCAIMYVCTYVHTFVCMYVRCTCVCRLYVRVFEFLFECTCVCMYACMYVYIYVQMYVYMYVRMYIWNVYKYASIFECTYVCMYVFMYVCVQGSIYLLISRWCWQAVP